MPESSSVKNTIHFETLGCRLNQDETEGAARAFRESGFNVCLGGASASSEEDENVILCIVNTCTVTTKAEQKARRIIRLLLQKYPESQVLVTGCYAELDGKDIKSIDERIVILSGEKKYLLKKLPEFLRKKIQSEDICFPLDSSAIQKYIDEYENDEHLDAFSLYTPVFEKHSRSSIKIQDGCNNNCSFCRIHLARGKSVSLSPEKILSRVRELEQSGHDEVVFTGVNLSQYAGKTPIGKTYSFSDLLEYLINGTESIKFRISSFYPQHVTKELSEIIKSPRVQPSFHLSIQSGSDRILKLMNRPYSRNEVYNAVSLLRQSKENPFISCDLIAGFPGESEDDFELTKSMCDDLDFSWIHAFPFSARPGTAAFSMKPKVPERIKDERCAWLNEKALRGKINYINLFNGKCLNAIVERKRFARWTCVTENFLHAEFSSPLIFEPGTEICVKIENPLEDNIKNGKETECSCTFESVK